MLAGCTSNQGITYDSRLPDDPPAQETADETEVRLRVVAYQDDWREYAPLDSGLSLVVEEGDAAAPEATSPAVAVTRLPEAEALALLDQVPALAGRSRTDALSLPTARLNPPPSGGLEVLPFPPLETGISGPEATVPLADLQILRYSPF